MYKKTKKTLIRGSIGWVPLLLLVFFTTGRPSVAEDIGADIRSITVLPPADNTGLNLGQTLQQKIGEHLYETRQFVVQYSAYSLSGFTAPDLYQAFERLDSQLILFAYVETDKLSLFLFDSYRPQEFIAASTPYPQNTAGVPFNAQTVIDTFPAAFEQLMAQFQAGQYQILPGAQVSQNQNPVDDTALTRELFRKLAALKSSEYYAGANIGLARVSANDTRNSTVNLSLYSGYKIGESSSLELNIDLFSFAFIGAAVRFDLPFWEDKLIRMDVSGGAGMIMGALAEHRGFPSSNLPNGSLLFGPGMGVHIPLAGADIRCEIRFMLGSGSLFIGTYGLSYAI